MKSILEEFKKGYSVTDPEIALQKLGKKKLFYHQLPTEYFRYEAVFKIDDIPLYLTELSSYKEVYKYPFHEIHSLSKVHYYQGGGATQHITFKVKMLATQRKSLSYLIQIANKKTPVRFVTSHDEQVRSLIINSISATYTHWTYAKTIQINPRPLVGEFEISAFVLGSPLPPISSKQKEDDPSLNLKESKVLQERARVLAQQEANEKRYEDWKALQDITPTEEVVDLGGALPEAPAVALPEVPGVGL